MFSIVLSTEFLYSFTVLSILRIFYKLVYKLTLCTSHIARTTFQVPFGVLSTMLAMEYADASKHSLKK